METLKEKSADSAVNKNTDTTELISKMKATIEENNKKVNEIRKNLSQIPQSNTTTKTNNQKNENININETPKYNTTQNPMNKENIQNNKNYSEKHDQPIKRQSSKHKKKKNKIIKGFLNFCFYCFVIGFVTVLFLLYGPYNKFREWYITTAMTTMTHQYLATWFYSQDVIDDVQSHNRVIEVEGITDTSQIVIEKNNPIEIKEKEIVYASEYEKQVLQPDMSHPDYKLISIKEKDYEGILAVVYDASKIRTLVTSGLGSTGQYVTTMAEKNKAVLAINGGGFEDENHNSAGGVPLGLTISQGKVMKSLPYRGSGGMIGFDTDDKLVLGKVSVDVAKKLNIRDCVTCGPFLIINGVSSEVLGNGGWGTAPRTAIGQRKDGIVLMLVVDGRKPGMPGADMDDLIKIMERYGAYNAAALDGGTSTVMVENYQIINDPVNASGKHKTRPIATAFGVILDDE